MDDNSLTEVTRAAEAKLLWELRALRRGQRKSASTPPEPTFGQAIADRIASAMGSWTFIIAQSVVLLGWIILNVLAFIQHWDPYPFILLNLALSFQAAYAAPFIMMSQNRQAEIDRLEAANDYKINVKAELEIELLHDKLEKLHDKLDLMREREIDRLSHTVSAIGAMPTGLRLELFVDDIAVSRAFYEQALGFDSPENADHEGYLPLYRDGAIIALNRRADLPADHPLALGADERPGRGLEIVVEVDDVDEAHAVAGKATEVSALKDQPWGLRDFRLTDPDGYYLRVTSRRAP